MKSPLFISALLGLGLTLASPVSAAHSNPVDDLVIAPLELAIGLHRWVHDHHHLRVHVHSPRCYREFPRRNRHWAAFRQHHHHSHTHPHRNAHRYSGWRHESHRHSSQRQRHRHDRHHGYRDHHRSSRPSH